MNRNQIIETMARGVCCPDGCAGDTGSGIPCDIAKEDATSMWQAKAALCALEAAGLVIVPCGQCNHSGECKAAQEGKP